MDIIIIIINSTRNLYTFFIQTSQIFPVFKKKKN